MIIHLSKCPGWDIYNKNRTCLWQAKSHHFGNLNMRFNPCKETHNTSTDLLASTLCCLHHWSDPASEWPTAPQTQLCGCYPAPDKTSRSPYTVPLRQQGEKPRQVGLLCTETAETFEKPCCYKQGNSQAHVIHFHMVTWQPPLLL